MKVIFLFLATSSLLIADNSDYRKHCNFAEEYAHAKQSPKSHDHQHSQAQALKSLVSYYMSKHKLHNNPNVSAIHQDRFALINNPQAHEAIAFFEIPDGKQVYLLNEQEIERSRAQYKIQETETNGSYRIIKFQYENEILLPENQGEALSRLYFPNVIDGLKQEDLSSEEWQEYFDQVRPAASALQSAVEAHGKFELLLGAPGKKILITATLAKQVLTRREGHKEGLIGTTAIKTESGYRAIKDLKIGDKVACFDKINKKDVYSTVTHVEQSQVPKYIQITLDKGVLEVAHEHKFYIERYDTFVTASELNYNPNLRDLFGANIQDIQEIDKPLDIFNITVDSHHNFYITKNNILVHNMIPFAIQFGIEWGPAGIEASWAFIYPALVTIGTYLLHQLFGKNNHDSRFLVLPYPELAHNSPGYLAATTEVGAYRNGDDAKTNNSKQNFPKSGGSGQPTQDPEKNKKDEKFQTSKEATAAAKELGYEKTNYRSHGQSVYKNGSNYITPDVDSHSGGAWKMARTVAGLADKTTRMGTFDRLLNKIGA